jgi:dihydrofolate reductase
MGKPCIMGRRTWESLQKKPLPGRTNIVLTRNDDFRNDGAIAAHSLPEALARAAVEGAGEIAVIGGADVYREALPHAHRIYLTEVHAAFEGDVSMPALDTLEWKEVAREDNPASGEGAPAFSFVTLERR